MTDLVESILSLSKMDSHTFDLHPTDLEVMEFLDECVDIMSTIRKDCVIHLEAERPLMIHTDPELLKRVIQNILSNCLRYADHEILIRMSTDGNSLILLIQDDGPGFLEKDLPHIFERFYKGNGGKNGIGLSLYGPASTILADPLPPETALCRNTGLIISFYCPCLFNRIK